MRREDRGRGLFFVVLALAVVTCACASSSASTATPRFFVQREIFPRSTTTRLFGGTSSRKSARVIDDALRLRAERSRMSPYSEVLLSVRGGARHADDSDEEDVDDEDSDDDVLFDLDDDEDGAFGDDGTAGGMDDRDFAEDNTLDRAAEAWRKTPPLTKGYLGASVAATVFGYVFNQNQFPSVLLLDWKKVLTGQVWRLFTSFLNFGPLGLGYVMTAHFVWTYMATLERLNHNKPYDFWIMIMFGQLSMVVGYPLLKLSPGFLGHNLSTFLVYIWSRYHEGIQVSMFDLFTARAEMLPWFFLAQTFLLEGELPVLDFLGIVFGHIYHHCKTVGILRAPTELVNWYKSDSKWAIRIRELYKPISSDFEMVA
jgi:Derlin-2/3